MNTMLSGALEIISGPLKNLLDQLAGEKNEIWVKILNLMSRFKPEEILYRLMKKIDLIDLGVTPFNPYGWRVEEHTTGGLVEWNPGNVALYLSVSQSDGKSIVGRELRRELTGRPVFNANLLDYLHENPNLIPEEWKGQRIFFWGTIYSNAAGRLCVRCLVWDGARWRWNYEWLEGRLDSGSPAAMAAN